MICVEHKEMVIIKNGNGLIILFKAICRLKIKEKGCYKLYSCLNKIKLNERRVSNGHFVNIYINIMAEMCRKKICKRLKE